MGMAVIWKKSGDPPSPKQAPVMKSLLELGAPHLGCHHLEAPQEAHCDSKGCRGSREVGVAREKPQQLAGQCPGSGKVWVSRHRGSYRVLRTCLKPPFMVRKVLGTRQRDHSCVYVLFSQYCYGLNGCAPSRIFILKNPNDQADGFRRWGC